MGNLNDKLNEFLDATGALIEMWSIAYKGFIAQGLSPKAASENTQLFIQTLLTVGSTMGDKK